MSDAASKLHSAGGAGAGAGFGSSAGGFEAGGFETGGVGSEPAGCSSFDAANVGETIAKDPTAAIWFAVRASRSEAIALPALAAMSDLIADASWMLAPLISEVAAGAAGLSPLQPLASINPAASAIRRYTRFCMMTPAVEKRLDDVA